MPLFKNSELDESSVKRVTWIRVGAFGDLLVSTRALESTIKRFPKAKIWVLGSRLWLEILHPKLWPQIDGVLVSENGRGGSLFVPQANAWRLEKPYIKSEDLYEASQVTINLRIESYRFAWGPKIANVPMRIGSSSRGAPFFYTHIFPWLGKEPNLHERDWYDGVVRTKKKMSIRDVPLDVLIKDGLPRLTPQDSTRVSLLWNLEHKKYLIVNPTASRSEKAWPKENFRELVAELSKKKQVIVVGASSETPWLESVSDGKVRVIQPQNLKDLFDLVFSAEFLVCNTSSLQFVAASQGTKALVLMGLASPLRWGPLGPNDQVIEAPTRSSVGDLFLREAAAYKSISLDQVLEQLKNWL